MNVLKRSVPGDDENFGLFEERKKKKEKHKRKMAFEVSEKSWFIRTGYLDGLPRLNEQAR
jgi:hypothetical protein